MHGRRRCSMLPCIFSPKAKRNQAVIEAVWQNSCCQAAEAIWTISKMTTSIQQPFDTATVKISVYTHPRGSDRRPEPGPPPTAACYINNDASNNKRQQLPSALEEQVCVCVLGESTGLSCAQWCAVLHREPAYNLPSNQNSLLERQEEAQQADISSM